MIQILLFALFPIALAQYGHGHGYGSSGGYGDNHGYDEHYAPQPYKFGYDVKDHYGSTLQQKEEGDSHGNKKGSYGYTDGHGVYRQVDYIADKNGFRATIKTNEPGTANENPADVYLHSSAPKVEYHSAPYKAQSYSMPSYKEYSAPSYGHGGYSGNSYSSLDNGYGHNNNNNNNNNHGYARSHSIPAVYYAKGY